jgi:hypothetical protein
MVDVTTIKVPRELRERVSRDARKHGLTAAALISSMLDDLERADRLRAVGAAYARGIDAEYAAELDEWEQAATDGFEA